MARRKLRAVKAPKPARILAEHFGCEVEYRKGKYLVVRPRGQTPFTQTLHESSEFGSAQIRLVPRSLGFSDSDVDELYP